MPAGYRVGVWEVPRLGQSESKRELKRVVQDLFAPFAQLPSDQLPDEGVEVEVECAGGEIRLMLFPERLFPVDGEKTEPKSLFGPVVSGMDDSESRIVKAVRNKRSQVRSSPAPAVLALHGGNMGADVETFDRALIGHSWERIEFAGGRSFVTERGFHTDGELYRRPDNSKPPTYAGVLALLDVGIFGIKNWAFYPHPRFEGTLPEPFRQLPTRTYNASTRSIEERAGRGPQQINDNLRFAVT